MKKTVAWMTIFVGAAMMAGGWYLYQPIADGSSWLPLFVGGFVVALIGGIAKVGAEMASAR